MNKMAYVNISIIMIMIINLLIITAQMMDKTEIYGHQLTYSLSLMIIMIIIIIIMMLIIIITIMRLIIIRIIRFN